MHEKRTRIARPLLEQKSGEDVILIHYLTSATQHLLLSPTGTPKYQGPKERGVVVSQGVTGQASVATAMEAWRVTDITPFFAVTKKVYVLEVPQGSVGMPLI